jgi:hypothetical protein
MGIHPAPQIPRRRCLGGTANASRSRRRARWANLPGAVERERPLGDLIQPSVAPPQSGPPGVVSGGDRGPPNLSSPEHGARRTNSCANHELRRTLRNGGRWLRWRMPAFDIVRNRWHRQNSTRSGNCAQVIHDFRDGVWLVELALIAEADRWLKPCCCRGRSRGPDRPLHAAHQLPSAKDNS